MNKIINFHDVKDSTWFEGVITLIQKKYKFISIEDIEAYYYDKKALKNTCHITVDDGDNTFHEYMYPVLKKLNIPATIFVSPQATLKRENFWFQEVSQLDEKKIKQIITKHLKLPSGSITKYLPETILKNYTIDEIHNIISKYKEKNNNLILEPQNLNAEQLKEIDRHGLVTIGAHTKRHPILANETDKISHEEIYESITDLEKILNHKIKYFAYPNGIPDLDFGKREIDFLTKFGCKLSFSTKPDNFTLLDNPLAIPRFGLTHGSKKLIKAKLFFGKHWETIKSIKSKSEQRQRIELQNIIKSSSNHKHSNGSII